MENISGTIILRNRYIGTKSEGYEAFLISEDLKIYKLGRKGHYSINDDYFYLFDKQDVEVVGEIIDNEFITVHKINVNPINESSHEENMPCM